MGGTCRTAHRAPRQWFAGWCSSRGTRGAALGAGGFPMPTIRYLFPIALAACGSSNESTVIAGDPVGETVNEGRLRGNEIAAQTFTEMSGANYSIVIGKSASILASLNDGDIDQASFAVHVVEHDDVFDFANRLI